MNISNDVNAIFLYLIESGHNLSQWAYSLALFCSIFYFERDPHTKEGSTRTPS